MGDRTGNGGKIKKAKGRIKKKPPSSLRRAKEEKNAKQKSPGFGGELDTAADRRGYNGWPSNCSRLALSRRSVVRL
jgi:hypothetical protein